jgi:transaldolase
MSRIKAITELGQQIWFDSISRQLIESGELARLVVEDGITGVTSNPAIFQHALATDPSYAVARAALPVELTDPEARFEALAIPDIRAACDAMLPLYRKSDGDKGFVSFEVSPRLSHDAEGTVAAARRLWGTIDRPNAMIKIPATPAGLIAIRRTIAVGINVNVTLMFSPAHVEAVARAYLDGIQDRMHAGLPVDRIRSVASVFISRLDSKLDPQLPKDLRGRSAIAMAKTAYARWQQEWGPNGSMFARIARSGARPQSLLWASTGTKNPAYPDVLYVESLIGPQTVNTVPVPTLDAFRDHGFAASQLEAGVPEALETLARLVLLGFDIDEIGETLQKEGLAQFDAAFQALLASVH